MSGLGKDGKQGVVCERCRHPHSGFSNCPKCGYPEEGSM